MKININLLLIIFFLSKNIMAQFPCDYGISTNPSAPYNTQQSSFSTPYFLNAFDWHGNDGNTQIYDWPVYNMGSYWNQGSGYLHAPFTSSGLTSDYTYFYSKPLVDLDFYPEDGWELISVNLGAYPDGTVIPGAGSSYKNIPYVLLYNKYRSILRLFANTQVDPLTNPYKGVEVTLTYADQAKVAGTLNGNGATFSTLDKKTDITSLTSIANHPNNYSKWFYVDYEVAYDPCVCHFKSDLSFDFNFIQSSSRIELIGRAVTIEKQIVDTTDGSANYSTDFLSSIDYAGSGGMENAGTLIFKEIDGMYQYYIDELERIKLEVQNNIEYNKKIDRWITVVRVLKVVAITGVGIYTGNPQILATGITTAAPDLFLPDGNVDKKKFEDEATKIISAISSKVTGKLESRKKPEEIANPENPSAFFTEMSFSGQITSADIPYDGPIFFNPGTYGNSESIGEVISPHNYPVYNEAMGIFGLLQTPELTFQKDVVLNSVLNTWLYDNAEVRLKPSTDLKYVLNPALDINFENSKVEVAIEFVPYIGYELYPNGYTDVLNLVNANPKYINSNETDTNKPSEALPWFTTEFVPIECYSDLLIEIYRENPDQILFEKQGSNVFDILKANIKFRLDLEYNSTNHYNEKNSGFYVYSYPMDIISGSVSGNPLYNLNAFEKNITITDTLFTQNTTIHAWNDVTISGELTCSPGVVVSVLAGNEIIVEPESEISSEITLEILPILPCDNSFPLFDQSFVNDFCSGQLPDNVYQANIPRTLPISIEEDEDSGSSVAEDNTYLNLHLYPNPANDILNLTLMSNVENEIVIELIDLTGQILESKQLLNINERNKNIVFSISNYANGYYFINVKSGSISKTEKLVIQK